MNYFQSFFILAALSANISLSANENFKIAEDGNIYVLQSEVKSIFTNLSNKQKSVVTSKTSSLEDLVLKVMNQKKRVNKAIELNLDKKPNVQFLIENAKNKILEQELTKHIRENIKVPSDLNTLAHEYFLANPDEFIIPEKVDVDHILISFKNKSDDDKSEQLKKTQKILLELQNGLDFNKAAKLYSDDTGSAEKGGALGLFKRGKMVKEFENAAFKLTKKNELSPIVKTQYGYHIIKFNLRKPQSKISYTKVKEKLIADQQKQYIQKIYSSEIEKFNNNSSTTLFMSALEKLRGELKDKIDYKN